MILEKQIHSTAEKLTYSKDSEEFREIARSLSVFPNFSIAPYFALSSPVYDSTVGEEVVTGHLSRGLSQTFFGITSVHFARKFLLESKRTYLRVYVKRTSEEIPEDLREFEVIVVGKDMKDLYGDFLPPAASRFYFIGNPTDVETKFALDSVRGAVSTYYSYTLTNGVAKVKQYCYDNDSFYADWDSLRGDSGLQNGT